MEKEQIIRIGKKRVRVDDPPFSAVGDGATCDRAAIQNAIDTVAADGGGTVVLTAGRTYLTSGLVLRDHTELFFEENAELLQSPDPADYVKPAPGGSPVSAWCMKTLRPTGQSRRPGLPKIRKNKPKETIDGESRTWVDTSTIPKRKSQN